MKITINKEFTTINKNSIMKQAAKEFRGMYTDNDLLRLYQEGSNNYQTMGFEVLKASVEIYPTSDFTDTASACIEVVAMSPSQSAFAIVSYYLDGTSEGDYVISPILQKCNFFKSEV